MDNEKECWLKCPVCNNNTRTRVRKNTMLVNFSLYCPKCKQETLINVQNMNMTIVKEPDTLMRSQTTRPTS